MGGITPVSHDSLGERIAHQLRRLVVSGELAADTHLAEDTLAEQFGVSRGPVRDALRTLEAEGLLVSRRRRLFVRGLSPDDVEQLYSLREALESLALRRTMQRAEPADWDRLEGIARRLHEAADEGDSAAFADIDMAFHSFFYDQAEHPRLVSVWAQYRPTFAVMLDITNAQDRDLHPAADAHVELLELARSGQTERALTTLSEHLLGSSNRLRAAIAERQQRRTH